MSACTFFGHRDCMEDVKEKIVSAVEELVNKGVDTFYVGTHGNFDFQVLTALRKIKERYPRITYWVVLAYLPAVGAKSPYSVEETVYPEGMEKAPKRFAITYRNRWMLQNSDYVIAYVSHTYGGAAGFVEKALRAKKTVINLAKEKREDPL